MPDSALADSHVESELETWIAANPEIIGDRILIIDRQRDIPGVGRLDLLGIDQDGALIIIELKRDRTPREAVAQALDYASWLDSAGSEQIIGYAESYLRKPLAEVFAEYFRAELPELSCQNHKISLVAPRLDASAERIITYLSERYGVDINAVFFHYARLQNGNEIVARTILVDEQSRPIAAARQRRPTTEGLLSMSSEHAIAEIVEACRGMKDSWTEAPSRTYNGSFRYWATSAAGQRMVFGVNVAGKYEPANGELDVWIPVRSLAEVTGTSEDQTRASLRRHNVIDMQTVDCWIRLRNTAEATLLVDELRHLIAQKAVTGA